MNAANRRILVLGLVCGLALLCLPATAPAEPTLPSGFQDTVVFDGLEQPTAFRFSPDGRVFVAEKGGLIKVYSGLEDKEPEVFADLRTDVYDHGDRGLLGLALDPNFPDTPYVYALYTYDHILGDPEPPPKWGTPKTVGDECPDLKGADDCVVSGRLVRLTAAEGANHALPTAGSPEQKVLAEGWCQQFSSHSIGDLQFGPEGALYASGGDGASFTGLDYGQLGTPPNPCGDPPGGAGTALTPPSAEGGSLRSQNLSLLNGKIIRVDPASGEGWPDNPLAASLNANTRRIVAEGFRNPFRFTIDPKTGEIYSDNVGSSDFEEIDRFPAPPKTIYNSGWPCYEGPVRQYLFAPLGLTVCENLYASEPGSTSKPFFYYSHKLEIANGDECSYANGSAIGGIAFYEGKDFPPAYHGALFFSDPVRGCLYVMYPGEDGKPDPLTIERFMREGQIYPGVDIEEGPDGALYYASLFGDEEFGPGAIHRIAYAPGAPTARLEADHPWGSVEGGPLKVTLDASASSDPNEDPLTFEWDLDGNGTFETSGGKTQKLEFTAKELKEEEKEGEDLNRTVAVRVSDGKLSSVARITLYPGDEPPEPTIEAPKPTETWEVGQKITLISSAIEFGGEHVSGLGRYWSVRLAHCPTGPENCHKHPLQVFAGLPEASFLAPEHDYPSYIEITLRVTDERGLAASKTLRIDPRTVALQLESEPPGITLTAGLSVGPAPFSLTAIEGSHVAVSAPQTAQLNGKTYTWQGWSDGGARAHTILADKSGSYRAKYSTTPEVPSPPPPPVPSNPQTKLGKHPPRSTRARKATFVFTSSSLHSRFFCKLDHGAYRSCRSPKAYSKLKPGRHTFAVYAVDSAGDRDGTPATFVWKVR
ncbi:MAG TPA: PQQ-dependent sugar dehydrogenase [Solirubrobacterales bacterium]|nr:PQQ-dependent sugar dehydrogenase [Solirubrobacterales bacterium]